MTLNHLADETSPYLQQHADNPVDWYPWNDTALKLAKDNNKPILLSIGYSACHWCHVMAHESFEDPDTADLMNQLFINIKVDREERPDLDKIYQTAHYMLTQRHGGWPLTMFLTPGDQIPFFGGTYFPKTARYGLPGFKDLMQQIATAFSEREKEIQQQNLSVQSSLNSIFSARTTNRLPGNLVFKQAFEELKAQFDPANGGFGQAPKFPHPTNIDLLLHLSANRRLDDHANEESRTMATFSLKKMASGGVYDQIGGGFCRYSVDDLWMIPHFEKMLYDNGPLLSLYAREIQEPGYANITQETADWVIREMQSTEGGYFSSLDADSEGQEGKFYVWSPQQVRQILSDAEYSVCSRHYGLDRDANFEGQWHFHSYQSLDAVSNALQIDQDSAVKLLKQSKQKLYESRSKRVWPGRDEKILLSWNALMVKGMLQTTVQLDSDEYLNSARKSLQFIQQKLWINDRLLATYKDGRAHLNAYLDDYAFLLDALIEMLQVEWDNSLLEWAVKLADCILSHFEDRDHGGFFFTSDDHEQLIQRPKTLADEATPSGYAIATLSLQRLGWLLSEQRYLLAAERSLQAATAAIESTPSAYGSLLIAYDEYLNPPAIYIIRGNKKEISRWKSLFTQNSITGQMCFALENNLKKLPESLQNKKQAQECVAYLCHGTSCSPPIKSKESFIDSILQKQ